jgi:hypothetical protein
LRRRRRREGRRSYAEAFGEDTLKLEAHIASLVSGAIENAQLYDEERRRVDLLTGLSELTQQVAAASGTAELGPVLVQGMSRLLDADVCQLLRLQADGETLSLLASVPETLAPPATLSAAELTLAAIEDRGTRGKRPTARALWPSLKVGDLLVTPVAAGERVGLMCAASTSDVVFSDEDAEIARPPRRSALRWPSSRRDPRSRRSPARPCRTAARSAIRRSGPTATWCRSRPTTRPATGCGPPSIA